MPVRVSLRWILVFSLTVALTLYFYPLRGEASLWRPLFVFLVVVYWLFAEPHRLGIGFAWLAGLGLDILTGGVPGRHALAMAVCAYLICLAGQRLHHFSVWHQTVLVSLLAVLYQSVIVFVNLLVGREFTILFMYYPVVTTVLLWPLTVGILSRFYCPE